MSPEPRVAPGAPVELGRLSASIDQELEPAIELLGGLVAQESVEGSDAIARCIELIDGAVQPLGGRRRRVEFDGLPNLVADWGDADDDRRLILAGHADGGGGGGSGRPSRSRSSAGPTRSSVAASAT